MQNRRVGASVVAAVLLTAAGVLAQDGYKNLQFFPEDIPRGELIQHMRAFSFALDVRCQHCHAGGDGISFDGVVFESDEKLAKQKARAMLRMVEYINSTLLPEVPGRRDPAVAIGCATCHRGLAVPRTLGTELAEVIASQGSAGAVARYRELRSEMHRGRYNFGEWEINELARVLTEDENGDAAIAMLEMNAEYYPDSVAIDMALANLHETRGERDKAIARYGMALEKQPNNARARERLEGLARQPD